MTSYIESRIAARRERHAAQSNRMWSSGHVWRVFAFASYSGGASLPRCAICLPFAQRNPFDSPASQFAASTKGNPVLVASCLWFEAFNRVL